MDRPSAVPHRDPTGLRGRFRARPGLGTEYSPRWVDGALQCLVDDPAEFAARNWGRATHVSHTSGALGGLITSSDIAGVIAQRGMRAPDVRLMKDGEPVNATDYLETAQLGHATVDGLVRPDSIADLLKTGATLILQGARRYCAPIDAFCRSLDTELRQVTQAGLFLTPPHGQGAPHHYDFYDAFLYQLEGAKSWRIGQSPQRVPRHPWRHGNASMLDDTQSVRTEPGDCMYLPRGTYHSGEAEDTHSLHLTIRIVQPYTYRTLVDAALDEWFGEFDLDSPLPIGYETAELATAEMLLKHLTNDERVRRSLAHSFEAIYRDFDAEVGGPGQSGIQAILDALNNGTASSADEGVR